MSIDELTIKVNDAAFHCRITGDGEPLLMLHGFFASGEIWRPYFDELAADFQLIVPDLRGHGRSTNPIGTFTHRQSAYDMYALLDALGIGRFRAVGYSSGGMTLIHMATQQPQRIRALSLWAATHYFGDETRARQRLRTFEYTEQDSPEWLQHLRKIHAGGDAQIRQLMLCFQRFADTYDDMNFTLPYLKTIQAPTLIVHGDRDEHFPVHIPVEMYTAIPDASLLILPETPHHVFGTVERFKPLIWEFLKRH